jgi:hypothetical protein
MANFKTGDQVTWIKKMAAVPHPEGKTDRDGNILPVFRDTPMIGRIIERGGGNSWFVRPQSAELHKNKICGERYYDVNLTEDLLTHV